MDAKYGFRRRIHAGTPAIPQFNADRRIAGPLQQALQQALLERLRRRAAPRLRQRERADLSTRERANLLKNVPWLTVVLPDSAPSGVAVSMDEKPFPANPHLEQEKKGRDPQGKGTNAFGVGNRQDHDQNAEAKKVNPLDIANC